MLPRVTEGPVRDQLRGLFKGELPLGHLCDVLGFALPLPPEAKQELLESAGRARAGRTHLDGSVPGRRGGSGEASRGRIGEQFPPDFSVN